MDWISKCQSARIEIYPIVSLKVSTLLSLFSYGSVGMCCRRPSNASLMLCKLLYNIREHLLQKRMFSFGYCPKREGGGGPCPNLLALFSPCNCPLYLKINIMLCVYLLVIFNTKIIKNTKIIITILL